MPTQPDNDDLEMVDLSVLGVPFRDEHPFLLSSAVRASFADVVLARESRTTSDPLIGVLPSAPALQAAQLRVLRNSGGHFPGVHAGSLFLLHQPIGVPGEVTTEARPMAIYPTSVGTAIDVQLLTYAPDGTLLWDHWNTAIAPGRTFVTRAYGTRAPTVAIPARDDASVVLRTDVVVPADGPRRFALLQRVNHPLHFDVAAASAAGFGGVVAHGTHVLALVCAAVLRHAGVTDSGSLFCFGARLRNAVEPGRMLRTTMWSDEGAEKRIGFDVADESGHKVITHGIAVLGGPS